MKDLLNKLDGKQLQFVIVVSEVLAAVCYLVTGEIPLLM